MSKIKNIAVGAVLAVVVAAGSLAGCGLNGKDTAIVVDDKEINLGTANFILRYQQAQAYSMMQMYGLSAGQALWDTEIDSSSSSSSSSSATSSSSSAEPTESASSSSETVESSSSAAESTSSTSGEDVSTSSSSASSSSEDTTKYKTYGDQFKNSTVLNDIKNWCALEEHLDDYSVSLSDDQLAQIDEAAKNTYDKNKSILKKMGTSEDDIKEALKLMSYEYLMRPKLNAEVDTNVSDEEAAQSTFTYARFSQTQTDSSTHMTTIVDDDTKAKYESEANQILQQIQASGDVANADISTIASGVDQNCESSQGSYGSDDTTYPDEVKNALATLSDGEVYGSVIDAGGYYWVVRLDKQFDQSATDTKKQSIVSQRQTDHYKEVVDQWASAEKVTTKKAWDKLKVTDDDEYSVLQSTDTTGTTDTTESTDSGTVSGSSVASSSAQ
jgi:foldase protein PrsA